jgi:hypothetical protein
MLRRLARKLLALRDYPGYIGKSNRLPLNTKARCRGWTRAWQRRLRWLAAARWKLAHERSLPFRTKKIEAIEKARRHAPKA